jgi:tetratricopeptide (TPR) repeat protein
MQAIMADNPDAAETLADSRIDLALCELDEAAAKAALAMSPNGCQTESFPFPHSWCEGVVARAFGDVVVARAAFSRARAEVEKIVREQRNYAEALCVLGTIDAALGHKQEAIGEGRRAVDLLPLTKDSINGAEVLKYLALIYAWSGEKDLAIQQLIIVTRIPSGVTYGQLRLHPYWDPLRGDPRFEEIVASLAPKRS